MRYLTLAAFFAAAFSLSAQEPTITDSLTIQGAYYIDNNQGWGQTGGFAGPSYSPVEKNPALLTAPDEGRNLGSGWGGAEFEVVYKRGIAFPFLQGDGALTKDNSVKYNLSIGLNPVSLRGEAEAVLTPIAFLQFALGGHLGTGWDAVAFNGLGMNTNSTGVIDKQTFGGAVLKAWAWGLFQFDLAAVVPGEWNHVVVLSQVKAGYQHYTAADSGEAWQWQADGGENFNTFKLFSTHFLGYQMPLALNTVGVLFETETNLEPAASYSRLSDNGWGSDFVKMNLGALTNWTLGENSTLAVLFQLENFIDYTDATIFNKWYAHRSAEAVGWRFKRVAFQWTLHFQN